MLPEIWMYLTAERQLPQLPSWHDMQSVPPRTWLWGCLAGVLLVGGCWLVGRDVPQVGTNSVQPSIAPANPVRPPAARPRPEIVIPQHLEWADHESEQALERHLMSLERFFATAKGQARPFAESVLGWSCKWRFVADCLPFTSGNRVRRFLRQEFERQVFSAEQLEQELARAVSGYLAEVRSIESQLLVRLRADLADLPLDELSLQLRDDELPALWESTLSPLTQRTTQQVQAGVTTDIVSLVVGEVLAQATIQIGVSNGILTTGTSSSGATLGIGLLAGIVVDQLVSWIWDWWADPTGLLANELVLQLDALERQLLEGTQQSPGFRSRLREFARQRVAWRARVLSPSQSASHTERKK